jgi:hypothetical protein
MHAQRFYKHGDPLKTITPKRNPCSVDECDTLARYSGYCVKHFRRVRSTGSPHIVRKGGRPTKGVNPAWHAIHKRLNRERGSAAALTCVDCGSNAREWSYDNADPNELIDAKNSCRYSLDLSHYEPRCTSCHRMFDKSVRETPRIELWIEAIA